MSDEELKGEQEPEEDSEGVLGQENEELNTEWLGVSSWSSEKEKFSSSSDRYISSSEFSTNNEYMVSSVVLWGGAQDPGSLVHRKHTLSSLSERYISSDASDWDKWQYSGGGDRDRVNADSGMGYSSKVTMHPNSSAFLGGFASLTTVLIFSSFLSLEELRDHLPFLPQLFPLPRDLPHPLLPLGGGLEPPGPSGFIHASVVWEPSIKGWFLQNIFFLLRIRGQDAFSWSLFPQHLQAEGDVSPPVIIWILPSVFVGALSVDTPVFMH